MPRVVILGHALTGIFLEKTLHGRLYILGTRIFGTIFHFQTKTMNLLSKIKSFLYGDMTNLSYGEVVVFYTVFTVVLVLSGLTVYTYFIIKALA